MTKRITLATIKSFIKKNSDNLYLKKINAFDGMCDGISDRGAHGFTQVAVNPEGNKNRLGIEGAWFTSSGNLFTEFDDGVFKGYDVYNCCGNFVIATK
jgi:hypothetical protein